jgi:hypothetical protein
MWKLARRCSKTCLEAQRKRKFSKDSLCPDRKSNTGLQNTKQNYHCTVTPSFCYLLLPGRQREKQRQQGVQCTEVFQSPSLSVTLIHHLRREGCASSAHLYHKTWRTAATACSYWQYHDTSDMPVTYKRASWCSGNCIPETLTISSKPDNVTGWAYTDTGLPSVSRSECRNNTTKTTVASF